QARGLMHAAYEVTHLLQRLIARLDHQIDAFAKDIEVRIGDQRRHLDQLIVDQIEPGHLAVDPDQEVARGHIYCSCAFRLGDRRCGLAAYTGTHLINHAEPAQVINPIVTAAAAKVASALTALISSGPVALPRSLQSLHPARNWARSCAGEASAPRVRTTPEEIPLPRSISAATRPTLVAPLVSGNRTKPSPSTIIDGAATYTRPNRSMIAPPG